MKASTFPISKMVPISGIDYKIGSMGGIRYEYYENVSHFDYYSYWGRVGLSLVSSGNFRLNSFSQGIPVRSIYRFKNFAQLEWGPKIFLCVHLSICEGLYIVPLLRFCCV